MSTLQFLTALIFAPRYGLLAEWWRRSTAVAQTVVEDILGWMIRHSETHLTEHAIATGLKSPVDRLRKELRNLERQGLIDRDLQGYSLTEKGHHEARRLVRAHRLWEAYLEHVGMPVNDVHGGADRLEHVHDEETVDYLDDKLGHPLLDPHGEEIPEDFVHLVPGAEVNAALLRAGNAGVVIAISASLADLPIKLGDTLTAGQREENGKVWSFHNQDGREIKLHHEQVDGIKVRFS